MLLGLYKASSLLIRRIGQASMLLPCYLCFKSSTGAIVEKGQVAVEVIITQNFSFPFPPFPLLWWINRPVCTHNTTRPFCTIEYESIHIHPPHCWFFPPLDIDSTHEPAQFTAKQIAAVNSTVPLWGALIDFRTVAVGSSTQEGWGFTVRRDAAQLLIAIFYSET